MEMRITEMHINGNIQDLALIIHKNNVAVGWWPLGLTFSVLVEKSILIHSEISETMEGLRKGNPDSHLPHRSAEEVELADTLIRTLDLLGAMLHNNPWPGFSINPQEVFRRIISIGPITGPIRTFDFTFSHVQMALRNRGPRNMIHRGELLDRVRQMRMSVTLSESDEDDDYVSANCAKHQILFMHELANKLHVNEERSIAIVRLICEIVRYNDYRGMDVLGAMLEKLEYNAIRADHKKENRESTGGKAF